MKNLKPVPADKKKSLGKLPTDVRNKMGYAKKGKMMDKKNKDKKPGQIFIELKTPSFLKPKEKSKGGEMASNRRKRLKDVQNPKSEYDEKGKLKYTAAKKGKMITGKKEEDDVSKYVKSIKLPDAKDVRDVVNKKAMGGEMKKPMKAVLGAAVLGAIGAKAIGKAMKKKASASPGMNLLSKESGMKLPMKDLYQKATEQQMAKKSMGGEMKQGYGAARTSGMGLQDEDLIPGKSMDYYKDLM
jgi:hypothetical protein